MAGKVLELNDKNFQEAVEAKGQGPLVVDFWASWCGPCLRMAPVFEQLADELDGVRFAKVNIDEAQATASQFGVTSIPYFLVVKEGGEVADKAMGGRPKQALKEFIQNAVG